MTDPYYSSPGWRRLCAQVAKRSGGKCEAPGCKSRAVVVDHIIGRRVGGADALPNLRHLCRSHDNAVKEDATGKRRSGGILAGVDAHGMPTDPSHPWHRD